MVSADLPVRLPNRRVHPTWKDMVVLDLQASDASADLDAGRLGVANLPNRCSEAVRGCRQ
jgi:hypothetical protein